MCAAMIVKKNKPNRLRRMKLRIIREIPLPWRFKRRLAMTVRSASRDLKDRADIVKMIECSEANVSCPRSSDHDGDGKKRVLGEHPVEVVPG